jgi:hypothetical protein
MDRLASLIERQPKGSPLLQEFYSDPEIFRRDIDRIHLRHWLWDVTSVADKLIIDQNQQGVNSRYYRPGPYGPMESQTRSFSEWYLKELSAAPAS